MCHDFVAAELLNRQWIGIDVSAMAAKLVKHRLTQAVNGGLKARDKWSKIYAREDIPGRTDKVPAPEEPMRLKKYKLFGEQNGDCKGCGYNFPFQNLTIDHKTPTSAGGTDDIDNLQLLCGFCNSIKGDKDMAYLRTRLKDMGIAKP